MTDPQENKLSSHRAVITVLDDNAPEYASVAALVTQVGNFHASVDLIGQLAQAQTSPTTGITLDKAMLNGQMIDMALRVAGAVKAFASGANNSTLLAKVDVNKTTFTRARDDLRDDIAQEIHDLANTNIAALGPFGITAATLTALQTRISAYRGAIGSPKIARAQKSTTTSLLETEFTRADMILNDRIDGLVEQFKDSGTTFYSDYKNARRIDDTGSQPQPPPPPPPPPGP
jgi:hypothetical protein